SASTSASTKRVKNGSDGSSCSSRRSTPRRARDRDERRARPAETGRADGYQSSLPSPLPSVRPSVEPSARTTPTYKPPWLPSFSSTALRSGLTYIVTLSPGCTELRFQPWLISTLGAVISTVHSPSWAPSAVPSSLIDACGLVQRNCVIVPSIFTTRPLSKAAVEWCAPAGSMAAKPVTAAATATSAAFDIVFIVSFLMLLCLVSAAGLPGRPAYSAGCR